VSTLDGSFYANISDPLRIQTYAKTYVNRIGELAERRASGIGPLKLLFWTDLHGMNSYRAQLQSSNAM